MFCFFLLLEYSTYSDIIESHIQIIITLIIIIIMESIGSNRIDSSKFQTESKSIKTETRHVKIAQDLNENDRIKMNGEHLDASKLFTLPLHHYYHNHSGSKFDTLPRSINEMAKSLRESRNIVRKINYKHYWIMIVFFACLVLLSKLMLLFDSIIKRISFEKKKTRIKQNFLFCSTIRPSTSPSPHYHWSESVVYLLHQDARKCTIDPETANACFKQLTILSEFDRYPQTNKQLDQYCE